MDLDTNNELFPEGTYRFRVADVPEQGETKNGYMYFRFVFMDEGGYEQPYEERIMRFMMAPIMRAMGFEEYKPGKFHWEPTDCLGKVIEATIKHEKIEKGNSAGQVVARMKDIRPVASRMDSASRAAVMAQAPSSVSADDIPF